MVWYLQPFGINVYTLSWKPSCIHGKLYNSITIEHYYHAHSNTIHRSSGCATKFTITLHSLFQHCCFLWSSVWAPNKVTNIDSQWPFIACSSLFALLGALSEHQAKFTTLAVNANIEPCHQLSSLIQQNCLTLANVQLMAPGPRLWPAMRAQLPRASVAPKVGNIPPSLGPAPSD